MKEPTPNPFARGFNLAVRQFFLAQAIPLPESHEIADALTIEFNDLYPHTSLYARLKGEREI